MQQAPRLNTSATPLRILLLEDSHLDAELVAESVKNTGLDHVIDRVVVREEFIQAIDCERYDLILADYALPSFDGVAALALAHERCPDTPFVFVSGTLGEDVAVEAIKNGATDYVTKQKLDRLPGTVLRAINEAEARRERVRAERALRDLNETLERRIEERTRELAETNRQLVRQIDERERVEAALRQSQRLEAVGQLTSGVAHDFNNLLTVILGNIGFLERSTSGSGVQRRLSLMRAAAERGATLTSQLLAFSRRQRLEPKAIDLNEAVGSMRDLLQSSIGGAVRIETVLHPGLWPALVDPTQIELVVLNLAINARDAMAVGGSITITTTNVRLGTPPRPEEPPAGDYVEISVTDTGSGIPPEVLEHVFEPFFTTKEIGKGSGLGLAQVYGFAKQSGGGVRIETRPGEGTSVKVYLPRAEALDRERNGSRGPEAVRRACGKPVVLLVDDDSAVREITATMLVELGYVVVEAASGGTAIDALDREPKLDLLLVDYAMPGMNGVEVARKARMRRPDLPVVFITGFADTVALGAAGQDDSVVQKPFRQQDLATKVKAALARGSDHALSSM